MLRRKLLTLKKMSSGQRGLLLEAACGLCLARVALVMMPFRTVASRLGEACPPALAAKRISQWDSDAHANGVARAVGWAVRRVASQVPFRALCLEQGIAAKVMLKRRGIESALHFGVASGDAGLDAHAWLDSHGAWVTGYPVEPKFTELVCFL